MKKRQEGVAMIVVMCVMVLVFALSLALLLISSVLITNANRSDRKEQCRVSAVAVSELMRKEIETFPLYDGNPKESTDGDGSLKNVLGSVCTDQWRPYDKTKTSILEGKKDNNVIRYNVDGSGLPGTTLVELYWTQEGEEVLDPSDPESVNVFEGITLCIKVTNTAGEESATVISRYHPAEAKYDAVQKRFTSWKWEYLGRAWEGSDA